VIADAACAGPAGDGLRRPRAGRELSGCGYPGCTLCCLEQAAGIPFRVTLAENRVAGYQQLGSRFDDAGYRVVSNAAVYLNPITETHLASKFFEAANFGERVRDKPLAAEAGIDAHDQDVVDHVEDGDKEVDFGVGIDDNGGLHLVVGDELEGAMEMAAGLVVDADPVGAGLGEGGDEFVGVLDHEVAIEGQLGVLAEGGDDGGSDGDVGDEMAIHDVDVDNGATAALGSGDFVGEAGEVGGKDGWD